MTRQSSTSIHNIRRLQALLLAASILIFFVIVVGGIVRVTGNGEACPDWPTCLGQWTPPVAQGATINYIHRAFTILAVPFMFASGYMTWMHFRREKLLSVAVSIALLLFIVQIGLGAALAVGSNIVQTSWISAIHLGLSLVVFGLLLTAVVFSFYMRSRLKSGRVDVDFSPSFQFESSFSRLVLLTTGVMFLLLISGSMVTAAQAGSDCSSWPLCDGIFSDPSINLWISLGHRMIVLLTGVLMVVLLLRSWRKQKEMTLILSAVTSAAVLFFAQALLGSQMVEGFPVYLLGLHQATSVAVWGGMMILVTAVGLEPELESEEERSVGGATGLRTMLKDLLMLTKPIVVALLLVTTYAGMVIGGRAWPALGITFWTLLGGFLAAGGSGAINQYIDRFDDLKMQRTQKRPIPSGRLSPGQGLAFGIAMALISFYVMVAFVNLLAALLTLAGIIYYVLLYSIFLKKTTVQNIVIGGGAGAIPPLVGWAAVTGSLNIPSLFLFAIVFMWTPPHFWALALVRKKDYARAGVPMLPVIRGEKETRWQIFLYTVELVILTLLLPLFGLGGSIYLVGALLLGAWLLIAAWRVWKGSGNKVAWKMYRYSSMYLAFIFLVLMVDRLL